MSEITIRNCRRDDEAAIGAIEYRTGYYGEDLAGRNYFDDKRLLCLLFACYYTRYEPEHGFVAVDAVTDDVLGYLVGTADTAAQEKRFRREMAWKIRLRAELVTHWRYPGTYKTFRGMWKMMGERSNPEFLHDYPAHLHIDILPEYHGQGIGTRLMKTFEDHLIEKGVPGVHLYTSSLNRKAVPFYKKMGYIVREETKNSVGPTLTDQVDITFTKKLLTVNGGR
jgi:ribosomal protein S18 acetylase RimI-like enzyme